MLEGVDYVAMGNRLRMRRIEMKLTQERLAEYAGISASFVGHLERAEKMPSLATVADLCSALETSMDYIVLGKKNMNCSQGKCELYLDIKRVISGYEM